MFRRNKKHGKINFDLVYLVMNPGYNEKNLQKIIDNAKCLGIPIQIFNSDIFNIVDRHGCCFALLFMC